MFRQRIFLGIGFVIANQFVKYPTHVSHVRRQNVGELRPVIRAHSPGQARPVQFIARQRLSLLIIDALQQVFQTAQEEIGRA